ncbi:ribonuclease P protein component [Aestuariimicrobium kwangyangense]|uniref:ribonuclease P protein component n=1 Tax=Aestuariimicrobium kwangyangense TaxID=396389 RepID=UPI0003B4E4A6|nr:ribonuclease P protein component [Aestuariimicrobium kwangyangense]
MLAVAARLRASDDFRRTVRQGVRVARPTLVVHARTHHSPPGVPSTQVGFVVSKSVGGAVVRNRVKRRLRHLSRPLVESSSDLHVVVRALPAAASASSDTLASDLAGAWQATVRRLSTSTPARGTAP